MASEGDARRRLSNYWRDVAWQSFGSTLAHVVSIAGLPVLTRLYTPEEFAVQALFLQVVTFGTAIVTWRYEYFVLLPKLDDDARALNRLVEKLGLQSSFIERLMARTLAVGASRFLRMDRGVDLLVSDSRTPGRGSVVEGTYQTPILVQWRSAPETVRRVEVSLTRFR